MDVQLALASRNIVLFTIGKFISLFGASMYTFAAGLYVLKMTGSGTSFALALICGSVPRIICGPIAGAVADRVNRKLLVAGADFISALVMLLMFTICMLSSISLPVLYVSTALLAICASFFSVAFSAALPAMVDDDRLQKAGSINQAVISLSSILGPVLGGILYSLLPLTAFMLLNATAFLVGGILSCFIRFYLYNSQEAKEAAAFLESLREGFQHVQQNRVLFSILKTAILVNFFFCASTIALPYVLVKQLGLTSGQYGTVQGMFSVGMLATSLVLAVRKETADKVKAVRVGLTILALLFMGLAVPLLLPHLPKTAVFAYYMTLMASFGITVITVNIPIQVLVQRTTPSQYLGRVFGLVETIASAITPLGMVLFGFLIDYVPTAAILLCSGVCLLLTAWVGMKVKESEQPAEVQAG
ncbi:MFS transporter [Ectobacillus ponti]|uniref:MFS transporter n=1 Tax=Ectobacillus ponti TaxID=2961894 RepID=A0AA42BUY1_9BACI|nr:MFS transporter [Ectobacillus ponti]MCP8971008.1 MFS transporter [Ectobacillus ponti]